MDTLEEARQRVARLREANDPEGLARALRTLGELERRLPDLAASLEHYQEAVELMRHGNDHFRLAHTIRHLGDVLHDAGRGAEASSCYEEAIAIYRGYEGAPPLDVANALRSLAVLRQEQSDTHEALLLWRDVHRRYEALGIAEGVAESSRRIARLS
jgi:tetratricopeptide (TPR) repeat protein